MNPIDAHVGAFLRAKRQAIPLELSEVAAAVGTGPDDLLRIEEGRQRADVEQLQKFCQLFAITPTQLYKDAPAFAEDDVIAEAAQ